MHPFPTEPVVWLPNCVLRPYHVSDLEPMRAAADDPAMPRFMRDVFPEPYTREDALFWLRVCRTPNLPDADTKGDAALEPETPELHLAICLHDGTFAGGLGLRSNSPDGTDRHTREIGYWIARPQWGRGLATEAAGGFARWALAPPPEALTHPYTRCLFKDGPLRRVEAGIFAGNTPSTRVLARAGFVREGVRRQAVVKRGEMHDVIMFGLVQADLNKAEPEESAEKA
ncbi:acetyltransferase [Ophiostoma piceae UAMH 11346]|uniref:Acetyltransferase n=1 Tax=Ophiostoma piceae (strain UAMH 11346) TaxID=1262450 RepID=S3BZ57_OPHP1|nr:acetyltransferase [Ophiostoma piceae UAMH 11346]